MIDNNKKLAVYSLLGLIGILLIIIVFVFVGILNTPQNNTLPVEPDQDSSPVQDTPVFDSSCLTNLDCSSLYGVAPLTAESNSAFFPLI